MPARDKIVLSADGEVGKFGMTPPDDPLRQGGFAPARQSAGAHAASLTEFGPDDIFLGRKWITDTELRWKVGCGGTEVALGAQQPVRCLPRSLPVRAPAGGCRRFLSAQPDLHPFSSSRRSAFNGRYVYAPSVGQLLAGECCAGLTA